jgi:acetoin:2,6-dichlorophenolindophenol oxidoreductase subunit alpha
MIDNIRLIWIFKKMNLIRKFEEKALYLFKNNYLKGSVHLCIGQEAIPLLYVRCFGTRTTSPVHTGGTVTALQKEASLTRRWLSLWGKQQGTAREKAVLCISPI